MHDPQTDICVRLTNRRPHRDGKVSRHCWAGVSRHHHQLSPSPLPSPPRRGRGRIVGNASASPLAPAEGERVG